MSDQVHFSIVPTELVQRGDTVVGKVGKKVRVDGTQRMIIKNGSVTLPVNPHVLQGNFIPSVAMLELLNKS